MRDDTISTTTDDPGCGCCRPEAKTQADVVRELEARRERLVRRLEDLDAHRLVGVR